MNRMKPIVCVVLVIMLLFSACAFALTSEEKADKYSAAIIELETWLEVPDRTIPELELIVESF